MRSQLTLETTESGLTARVRASMDIWRIVWTIPAGGVFVYLLSRSSQFSGSPLKVIIGLVLLVIIWDLFKSARGTDVELVVENLDFVSRGHAPGGYSPCQVGRDDILRLEFREALSGGEGPDYPRGLYVEYNSDSAWETAVCVLPHIDKQQTQEVIDAIRKRFPEIDQITQPRPPKSGLISLNLE